MPSPNLAARFHAARDLRLAEEPTPVPAEGESLVRVTAVGLCGSDLHWYEDGGIGDARITHPLVGGQAEVVVGGEVNDSLAVVGADGGLLVVEHARLEEGAALAEVVELGGEMGKLGAFGGCGGHEFILILLWPGGLWNGICILRNEPFAKSRFAMAKPFDCGMRTLR